MKQQYEPCAHRTGQTGTGIRQEVFYTPCPTCQLEQRPKKGGVGFVLFLLAVAVAGVVVWSVS